MTETITLRHGLKGSMKVFSNSFAVKVLDDTS